MNPVTLDDIIRDEGEADGFVRGLRVGGAENSDGGRHLVEYWEIQARRAREAMPPSWWAL